VRSKSLKIDVRTASLQLTIGVQQNKDLSKLGIMALGEGNGGDLKTGSSLSPSDISKGIKNKRAGRRKG
jgi:hypothetical protein